MSGQQIGTVVGAVIGGYFFGPAGAQIGGAIGGYVGGVIDPTEIFGPRLTDASTQTARDGVPRTYGYGTFPSSGNLIWCSDLRERKKTEGGKGSTTETITYQYFRSYAIAVCEGPADGNGIAGYRIVKRNGKVVYDTRTDEELTSLGYSPNEIAETRAAQSKFTQRARFYYGIADQEPDPTIQAVKGADDVPGYSYTAYMVMTDDDVTELRGAVPQYEFVVSVCGDRTDSGFDYERVQWDESTETGGSGQVLDDGIVWNATTNTAGFVTANKSVNYGNWYWEHSTAWYRASSSLINHYSACGIIRLNDLLHGYVMFQLVGGQPNGGAVSNGLFATVELDANWVPVTNDTLKLARIRNRISITTTSAVWQVAVEDGQWVTIMAGATGNYAPYAVSRGTSQDGDLEARRATLYTIPDDFDYEIPEGYIPLGAVIDDIGIPIPDAPGYYFNPDTGVIVGPGGTTISECAPTLAEIVEDQCALREVTAVDVSDLEDEDVLGFRIANTSSPQKNILAAQPGYFFDSSEFDGVLHFPKRGGSDSFHIPFDDMVMREGETVQWERTQEAELLRKVTFTYFDPRATYTPTSQTGERRAGTIQAMGETASQLPLVGTGDWAAKAADINLKSAWYEPDECTFPVSLDWAELVPAAVGSIEDERGTIHRVRILDIKDDGLIRLVKARRTDAAAYQSNASGKPIPLPTFPGSDIRGPTTSAIFNMPAILDSHDRPGVYWAASGQFSSWIGASLQVQRAGQWVTIAQTVSGANVGSLADDLPYHGGDIDTINTFALRINTTLESVTYTQLLSERNPFAIAYPDATAEIIQFQDVELDSAGVWNCTKLLRGRLNTQEGLHASGATVASLDSLIQFVDLRPEDVGQTLLFRVVTAGTDPDTSTPFSVTFDYIWSSTEWEVAELEVERDGDDFELSWVPRHRLGTDVNPIRSGNWDGFLVRYQYADQFFEEVITETSKTYNLPGASDVEFTVFQLNRLTGAGPGVSVTHE
jgi:hypothetical protein